MTRIKLKIKLLNCLSTCSYIPSTTIQGEVRCLVSPSSAKFTFSMVCPHKSLSLVDPELVAAAQQRQATSRWVTYILGQEMFAPYSHSVWVMWRESLILFQIHYWLQIVITMLGVVIAVYAEKKLVCFDAVCGAPSWLSAGLHAPTSCMPTHFIITYLAFYW